MSKLATPKAAFAFDLYSQAITLHFSSAAAAAAEEAMKWIKPRQRLKKH
jgi:hypothetical protein